MKIVILKLSTSHSYKTLIFWHTIVKCLRVTIIAESDEASAHLFLWMKLSSSWLCSWCWFYFLFFLWCSTEMEEILAFFGILRWMNGDYLSLGGEHEHERRRPSTITEEKMMLRTKQYWGSHCLGHLEPGTIWIFISE